jgi:hypothetical protein
LADVEPSGSELHEPLDLLALHTIDRREVDVHSVLCDLVLG